MRVAVSIVCAVLGVTLSACGDDDPEDQCRKLFSALCTKISKCVAESSGLPESELRSECLEEASICEGAEDVRGDVDACIDSVNSTSCDELVPGRDDGDYEVSTPDECMADA